jgi:ATP-dependent Clp protease ATP-binding subunit ClpA
MFERFTAQARQVVVQAQQEARQLRHPSIGTEHLLLALLDAGSGGASVLLREAGVTRERVLADIRRFVGPASDVLGEGDAAALETIGIDLDAVRAKVEETFGPGAWQLSELEQPTPRRGFLRRRKGGHVPFSVRAKKVLQLSLREAIALKHNFIGSEHILLGLLRENGGLAAKILADAGVDFARLRRQTVDALAKAA